MANRIGILSGPFYTTKAYSLLEFGKNIGTQCPAEKIEYVGENDATEIIDCYFKQGANKDKSKG